jgi:asparagine synthase (glutamine-hydrolysing)
VVLYRADRTCPAAAAPIDHFENVEALLPHDVALVHTRYAIIDLSTDAHQPFVSRDGTVVAIFNGEIYNYLELRETLEGIGVTFRTRSDTEVLVEGYRAWGDSLWARLNGFWAVALYDLPARTLVLSRDRFGVAPLYVREAAGRLYFASSIAALVGACNGVTRSAARAWDFISAGTKDDDGSTMYQEILAFPPATTATFPAGASTLSQARVARYWEYPRVRWTTADLPFDRAVQQYRETFFDAVDIRLRADVPVAFELSGGMDSSSVVAAAATLRGSVTTYTIKVPEDDEEPFARAMLKRYPLDYHVLAEPEDRFPEDAARFAHIMEEPYHSPNIYTHYRMRCLMKAEGTAVVLAGAGGDEVLGGYEQLLWRQACEELRRTGHVWQACVHEVIRRVATPKRLEGTMMSAYWYARRRVLDGLKRVLPQRVRRKRSQYDLVPPWRPDPGGARPYHDVSLDQLQVANLPYYLLSNDHFTMAIPLEHRFPFLDYRLVEFGLQLPAAYLFRAGWTKYLHRRAMQPYLPREIVWRRDKMGFPFPYRRFLRTHRHTLAPRLARLEELGLPDFGAAYDELLGRDPMQLWRLCSTALWLEA